MSNDWRSSLREEEAAELKQSDIVIALHKLSVAQNQKHRKPLINKVIQRHKRHLKKGVDTVSEKA